MSEESLSRRLVKWVAAQPGLTSAQLGAMAGRPSAKDIGSTLREVEKVGWVTSKIVRDTVRPQMRSARWYPTEKLFTLGFSYGFGTADAEARILAKLEERPYGLNPLAARVSLPAHVVQRVVTALIERGKVERFTVSKVVRIRLVGWQDPNAVPPRAPNVPARYVTPIRARALGLPVAARSFHADPLAGVPEAHFGNPLGDSRHG